MAKKNPKTKTARTNKPAAAKGPARVKPITETSVPQFRVRMFRQGLGDCFLLTFDVGKNERHMLIDCGSLGNEATKVKISDVADHVLKEIGDDKLAVVIATHEHKDHLSGFNGPMQQLKGKVEQVWLAWTENPKDPMAQEFAKNKRDLGEALASVAAAAPDSDVGLQITDLLGFAGDVGLGAAKFAETINEAMEFVRSGLGAKTSYFKPGDLIEDPRLPGFRFYVLGPPRSQEAMKDLGTHESSELYGLAQSLRGAAALHAIALEDASTNEDPPEDQSALPFDYRYCTRSEHLKQSCYPSYFETTEKWRSIENDWFSLASDLALQLDSMTNNSSLAFAIERIADGKVFLFPADAQEGNWLSWHAPEMTFRPSGATTPITATDLLGRTVFYKVGHHCSHNATARGKGLELMLKEEELTAFIPVDRAIALTRNPKDSWQMPARPLYRRLLEKCQGRVARSDIGLVRKGTGASASTTEKEFDGMASDAEWNKWIANQDVATNTRQTDLFIECVM